MCVYVCVECCVAILQAMEVYCTSPYHLCAACYSLLLRLQSKAQHEQQPEEDEDQEEEDDDISLAQAISLAQRMREYEEVVAPSQQTDAGPSSAGMLYSMEGGSMVQAPHEVTTAQRSTLKQNSYFSDEDASDND